MGDAAMIRLAIGGNKSGKSQYGLRLLREAEGPGLLVATGRARDAAFREQIQRHKRERAPELPVVEVDLDLAGVLAAVRSGAVEARAVLVDSLDFWLFACHETDTCEEYVSAFLSELAHFAGPDAPDAVIVSSEAGLGPIPADAATRAFLRGLGALNQAAAALADEVVLVAAGLPLTLKR